MIIEIFLIFLGLAFLFIFAGYYIKEEVLIIFGFLLFILMSFPLLNQDLEIKSGEIIDSNYTYDAEGLFISSSDTVTYQYENYSNNIWFGLLLLLSGISGEFGIWYVGYKRKGDDDD